MEMSATHMDLDVHANLRIWNILLSLSRPYKCLVSACESLGKRIKFRIFKTDLLRLFRWAAPR
jgi:hypothetical protein